MYIVIGIFSTVARLTKKRPKKKQVSEADEPATNATPISDPSISEHQTDTENKKESLRLEEDLDAAVRNASLDDGSIPREDGKLDSSEYYCGNVLRERAYSNKSKQDFLGKTFMDDSTNSIVFDGSH